jgi:hypothetical protein
MHNLVVSATLHETPKTKRPAKLNRDQFDTTRDDTFLLDLMTACFRKHYVDTIKVSNGQQDTKPDESLLTNTQQS